MTGTGPRTQAERDAATVEMGFAVVTGVALAGATYLIVVGPAILAGVPEPWPWLLAGKWIAGVVFVARVAQVLVRWRRAPGPEPEETGPAQPAPHGAACCCLERTAQFGDQSPDDPG